MPLPQIVIDTNVIVSGLRSRRGSAFQLLTLIDTGQFDIHLSVPLVLEYTDVLLRELPNLYLSREEVDDLIDFYCSVGIPHRKITMSIVQVQIPDSLQKSLCDLASRDGISIDQFISTAIAEKLSALMTENYLIERAKRGDRTKYEAILAKVPDVEPEAYDKIPTV